MERIASKAWTRSPWAAAWLVSELSTAASLDSRSICSAASRWPSRRAETHVTTATAMPTEARTSTVSLKRIEPLRRRVEVEVNKLCVWAGENVEFPRSYGGLMTVGLIRRRIVEAPCGSHAGVIRTTAAVLPRLAGRAAGAVRGRRSDSARVRPGSPDHRQGRGEGGGRR